MSGRSAEAEAINAEPWIVGRARMGAEWHRQSAGWSEDQIFARIKTHAENEVRKEVQANPEYADGLEIRLRYNAVSDWFSYKWFACGLPRVSLSHRLAASLCSSHVPADCAPEVRFPWESFVVDVPDGLLTYTDHDTGVTHPVLHLFTAGEGVVGEGWWQFFMVVGRAPYFLQCISGKIWSAVDIASDADRLSRSRDSRDRTWALALRLALGAAMELSAHRPAPARGTGPVTPRLSRRGEPQCTMVRLTRDVKVDCRQHVRDYIRGASDRTLSVQHMVRGHWKMQKHGERGSERKFIHVEPYWRGPDDAPIALRNHVLTGTP